LNAVSLWRRLVAEFTGTALLVTVVVGSGIAASRLSPNDVGLELLENSTVTAFGLAALILAFGPVSGAHFNPAVSTVDWLLGRRSRTGLSGQDVLAYTAAQTAGAISGAVLADAMFDVELVRWSRHDRSNGHLLLGEIVATAGLVFLIFSLACSGKANLSAPAVGAYIGAAYWFTSSTSFANPAVTIGRAFTDTFAGIRPASVPGFIAAQLVGALVGLGLLVALHPRPGLAAADAVMPHASVDAEAPAPHIPAHFSTP
jgi:glycerol uptake facilitator-like aquaporin